MPNIHERTERKYDKSQETIAEMDLENRNRAAASHRHMEKSKTRDRTEGLRSEENIKRFRL